MNGCSIVIEGTVKIVDQLPGNVCLGKNTSCLCCDLMKIPKKLVAQLEYTPKVLTARKPRWQLEDDSFPFLFIFLYFRKIQGSSC